MLRTLSRKLPLSSFGAKTLPLIVTLGVFVRILAFFNLTVINPDGILYIAQAKAIASGQWDFLTSCGLQYVSLYPFLIAFFHLFVPDWIVSGQLVSLTFGCGLLVLIYPLVRCFSSPLISRLTVLLFALTPLLVRYSVDVMRDSTYWFLYCASVVVFLVSEKYLNKKLPLFLGLISAFVLALLASWCRIEALILLPAFFLYCLSLLKEERVRRASLLFVLLALLIGMGMVGILPHHSDFFALVRLQEAAEKFYEPMKSYVLLRSQLHTLASGYGFSLIGNFLDEAHHIAWSMPFAVILANACESFFYPFLPFYFLGFAEMAKQRISQTPLLLVCLLLLFGCIVLYVHVLHTWVMTYRFIALLLLPSSVVAALGIERCLKGVFPKLGQQWAVMAIVVWIVVCSFDKNIQPIEADKAVYPVIAQKSVHLSRDPHPVLIAGLDTVVHRWVSFYATAENDCPVCYTQSIVAPSSMENLIAVMRDKKMEFLLWEEHAWAKKAFGRSPAAFFDQFNQIGQWTHVDTGKLILFRLKNPR